MTIVQNSSTSFLSIKRDILVFRYNVIVILSTNNLRNNDTLIRCSNKDCVQKMTCQKCG
jgi:hypothetical protein